MSWSEVNRNGCVVGCGTGWLEINILKMYWNIFYCGIVMDGKEIKWNVSWVYDRDWIFFLEFEY